MGGLFAYSPHVSENPSERPCLEGYNRAEIDIYQGCIEEYSCRKLSYESGILDGCSGVLAYLSNRRDEKDKNKPLLFFWGLRVLEDGLDLTWYHPTPGLRRHRFPTWTWAGSVGSILHPFHAWGFMREIDQLEVGIRCDAEECGPRSHAGIYVAGDQRLLYWTLSIDDRHTKSSSTTQAHRKGSTFSTHHH